MLYLLLLPYICLLCRIHASFNHFLDLTWRWDSLVVLGTFNILHRSRMVPFIECDDLLWHTLRRPSKDRMDMLEDSGVYLPATSRRVASR
ncbi:hypothetical protein BDZ97DRAFT_1805857 [Flammula alnicola]|nr:hypothetical protein BDZ97DRAFT_1805857 [Flammula alnicola]